MYAHLSVIMQQILYRIPLSSQPLKKIPHPSTLHLLQQIFPCSEWLLCLVSTVLPAHSCLFFHEPHLLALSSHSDISFSHSISVSQKWCFEPPFMQHYYNVANPFHNVAHITARSPFFMQHNYNVASPLYSVPPITIHYFSCSLVIMCLTSAHQRNSWPFTVFMLSD